MLITMSGIGMVSPLLPIYVRDELGGPAVAVALSFSGVAVAQMLTSPFIGRMGDRFGLKRFIVAGFAVYSVSGYGYLLADRWELVIAFRVMAGCGIALIFPITLAYVGLLSPKGREGSFMGAFSVAQIAGFGIGPLIGGSVQDALGFDAAFTIRRCSREPGWWSCYSSPEKRRPHERNTAKLDFPSSGSCGCLPCRRHRL